jgi:hypothetical protein
MESQTSLPAARPYQKSASIFQRPTWVTEMIRLWNSQQFTYDQLAKKIGKDFGISLNRNKISGRLGRAKEAGTEIWSPGGPPNVTKKPSERKRRRASHQAPPPQKVAATVKVPTVRPVEQPPADSEPITLVECQERRSACRWPYGDHPNMKFCGKETAPRQDGSPSSYCHDHYHRVYRPVDEPYDDRKMARWFK